MLISEIRNNIEQEKNVKDSIVGTLGNTGTIKKDYKQGSTNATIQHFSNSTSQLKRLRKKKISTSSKDLLKKIETVHQRINGTVFKATQQRFNI